jgi:PGF-pre-PGF domain-containing protein
MNKTVWDGLAQRLGITAVNITIVGTGDTLHKCDDSGANCNEVTSLAQKVKTDTSAGTSTWTVPVTLGFSTYVDNPTPVSSPAAASSSGGGGGSTSASITKNSYSKTFNTLLPSAARTVTQGELARIDTAIREVTILVAQQSSFVTVTVEKLGDRPSSIPAPGGKVHSYVEINSTLGNENITESKIKFEVARSWMAENEVAESDISLARYSGGWQVLDTVIFESSADAVTYQATSPGFSTFAIVAGELAEGEAPSQPSAQAVEAPAAETPTVPEPPSAAGAAQNIWVIVGIVAAVVVGIAVYFLKMKKK